MLQFHVNNLSAVFFFFFNSEVWCFCCSVRREEDDGRATMQFEIPEKNLRLFAVSIQCLAKLGDEVGIEGREDKLVLRVLNMSHSAFAGLTFSRAFFGLYALRIEAGAVPSLSGLTCKCQVQLKACCPVFKFVVSPFDSLHACKHHLTCLCTHTQTLDSVTGGKVCVHHRFAEQEGAV